MNVRKFIAATAREALHKVKEMLGPEAIILSNRAIPGGVEIMAVAASEMEMIVSPPPRQERDEDFTVRISALKESRLAQGVPPARQALQPERASPKPAEKPGTQAEIVSAEVMEEIRSLRRMVEQHFAGASWGESARSEPVKTEILRQMLDAGFSPVFSRNLLAGLPRELSVSKALAWVREAANRQLQTIDPATDIVDRGGVYALVGPTGVGKTTTTAKLAARCVLRHGASKVALITTDGYRIGAYEQLRIYGRILGVSVYLVKDAQELRQTLADLQHKHMVLIDTMGMSQRDRMVVEQAAMLSGAGDVRKLLLLNATARGDTLDDVVRAYAGDDLAGCIFTKVDEAASLAPALDVAVRHELDIRYLTNGQRVPEDLHLPNRAYLLHRALREHGSASPWHLQGDEAGMLLAAGGA